MVTNTMSNSFFVISAQMHAQNFRILDVSSNATRRIERAIGLDMIQSSSGGTIIIIVDSHLFLDLSVCVCAKVCSQLSQVSQMESRPSLYQSTWDRTRFGQLSKIRSCMNG